MQPTKTVTAVGDEPVTVAEVKVSARIDDDITELDAHIATLITSCRLTAEHECERNFRPHTLRLGFSDWPSGALPAAPITELIGVEALDGTDWAQVSGFDLGRMLDGSVSLICTVPESELPALPEPEGERVRVTVNVGCPENVRSYIIAVVTCMLDDPTASPPKHLGALLDAERSWGAG